MQKILPVFILLISIFSCASKKETGYPAPVVTNQYKPLPSRIVVNYKLDKKVIRDTFNQAIAEIFKENFNIPDYDIKLNFYKTKDASVEIEGKSILTNIPVGILVEKNTFLVNMKARGVLELSFVTNFDMDSSWNFLSKTDLAYYKWIEKPVLSMGAVNIPVEPVSNVIISKAKPTIVENIDAAIIENFTIKKTIHESIQVFKDPMQLDPSSGGYLTLSPAKIHLQPLKNSKLTTFGKIAIDLNTQFSTSKPQVSAGPLKTPALYWSESIEDTSTLRLVTQLKMMDLNEIVRKQYQGKTFTAQGKSFTLGSIFLNCDYETMRFVSDVTGSINGTLIIKAKPYYDIITNSFKAKDVDFAFKTKNKIHKAASWIAEGYVRKELEKIFNFPLNDQIDEIQNDLNQQLQDINKMYNMDMKASLSSITSENFYIKPGEIETTIKAKVYIQTYIKDLRSIGSPKK
jgi:hypothetical protein